MKMKVKFNEMKIDTDVMKDLCEVDELDFGDMRFSEPVKKEEVKVVYYKREDKKKNDSTTGLF